jgi:hypothetical protein
MNTTKTAESSFSGSRSASSRAEDERPSSLRRRRFARTSSFKRRTGIRIVVQAKKSGTTAEHAT